MPISYFPSITCDASWGSITGNLADQTDLAAALNVKSSVIGAIPFYKSNGALSAIALIANSIPFIKTNGTLNNIKLI